MSTFLRWMPLDVTDYLNDTGHLSTLQHGAYMLLLMHYWRHGPLPDDDEQLAAITKTDAKAWKAMKAVIRRFFQPDHNGELHQKRADAERVKAIDISAKRKTAAKGRWDPPPNGHAIASPNAPPNAGANASPNEHANGPANADAPASHNVPSTSTTSTVRKESKELINKPLSSFPTPARESEPTTAERLEARNVLRKVVNALDGQEGKRTRETLFKPPRSYDEPDFVPEQRQPVEPQRSVEEMIAECLKGATQSQVEAAKRHIQPARPRLAVVA